MSAPTPDEDDAAEKLEAQPLLSHLVELRQRLLRVIVVVLALFLPLGLYANELFTLLAGPLLQHLPVETSMIATQVISPFLTPFKLALITAVFLAMPVALWQVWGFISPGLYQHEKRLAYPLLGLSIVLFYAGVAFAYYAVLPLVFGFVTSVVPEGVAMMTDIASYLDFVITVFFAFGFAFEIPVVIIVLVWSGLTTPAALTAKRPYVIVGVFVVGMLLTPPDIVSQTLLAVPTYLLYELGIVLARVMVPGYREVEAHRRENDR